MGPWAFFLHSWCLKFSCNYYWNIIENFQCLSVEAWHRISQCGDNMIYRPSYVRNGITHTAKHCIFTMNQGPGSSKMDLRNACLFWKSLPWTVILSARIMCWCIFLTVGMCGWRPISRMYMKCAAWNLITCIILSPQNIESVWLNL